MKKILFLFLYLELTASSTAAKSVLRAGQQLAKVGVQASRSVGKKVADVALAGAEKVHASVSQNLEKSVVKGIGHAAEAHSQVQKIKSHIELGSRQVIKDLDVFKPWGKSVHEHKPITARHQAHHFAGLDEPTLPIVTRFSAERADPVGFASILHEPEPVHIVR